MNIKHVICFLAVAMAGTQATAAPVAPATATPPQSSLVESVRSDCRWVDNKWTYQRGDKRLVCRPNRPSGSRWTWHREGQRQGWYQSGRRQWHHNAW